MNPKISLMQEKKADMSPLLAALPASLLSRSWRKLMSCVPGVERTMHVVVVVVFARFFCCFP
jgi:hypothetical protein